MAATNAKHGTYTINKAHKTRSNRRVVLDQGAVLLESDGKSPSTWVGHAYDKHMRQDPPHATIRCGSTKYHDREMWVEISLETLRSIAKSMREVYRVEV